ncbi:hypothetical protein RFI_34459, partial [Reticulomyxa filosa]
NVKIKVKDGKNVTTTAKAEFETKWGSVEVEEHSKTGTTVRFHVDNFFRHWNLRSTERINHNFFKKEKKKKKNNNNKNKDIALRNRVCTSECSISVQDNQYDLAVGGKLELEDNREDGTPLHYQNLLKSYSMGFLYTPTESTQYSLI